MNINYDKYLTSKANETLQTLSTPFSLIEPKVKGFLQNALQECNTLKTKYNNIFYNGFIMISIVIVIGIVLALSYKGELSVEEKRKKELAKRMYILQKIKDFEEAKKRRMFVADVEASPLTHLPQFPRY